jgi:plastocyanin
LGCGGGISTEPTVKINPAGKEGTGTAAADTGTQQGAAEAEAAGYGSWKGRVTFVGSPPQLAPVVQEGAAIKDPEVCAAQTIPNQRLLVSADGGVANVFIYLQRAPAGAKTPPVPQEPILFDQEHCTFKPHAMIVRAGQTMNITNSDPILHNTHFEPPRNQKFNQGINKGVLAPVVFKLPEPAPFEVKCDIHSFMHAYQIALDHTIAALTAEDGTFEIKDIPAGTHRFQVWHEGVDGGFLQRNLNVTIQADQVTELSIDYPAEKYASNARPAEKVVNISALFRN